MVEAQAELEELRKALAEEKMTRVNAQADLDAAKNKKPDTSEVDAVRKELQDLKDQHQASLMTAQQESAKATEEHLTTRAALESAQTELEKQKKERESDFNDMHSTLSQLCEEATKKAADIEAQLREAEAIIKVKEAELAEAKVCTMFV